MGEFSFHYSIKNPKLVNVKGQRDATGFYAIGVIENHTLLAAKQNHIPLGYSPAVKSEITVVSSILNRVVSKRKVLGVNKANTLFGAKPKAVVVGF